MADEPQNWGVLLYRVDAQERQIQAIGLTAEDVDDLFRAAMQIDA